MAKKKEPQEEIKNKDLSELKNIVNAAQKDAPKEVKDITEEGDTFTLEAPHPDETERLKEEYYERLPDEDSLIVVNQNSGEVGVVSEIRPDGSASFVSPISQNHPAFYKVSEPNILANFMANFSAKFKDVKWNFFIVPFKKVDEFSSHCQAFFENKRDQIARDYLNKHRTSGFQLEKQIYSKKELPFDALEQFISKKELMKDPELLRDLTEGRPIEKLFPLKVDIGSGMTLDAQVAIQPYRDTDGLVKLKTITPLPVPEYHNQHYARQLSTDDIKILDRGGTAKKLVMNKEGVFCYACINSASNTLHLKPADEVKTPQFINGRPLSPTQIDEIGNGREIFLEGCKLWDDKDNTFSAKVSYDIKQNGYVNRDTVYAKPYITQHVKEQLKPDEIRQLENYMDLDARHIKKRNGGNYTTLSINRTTNTLQYFSNQKQQQRTGVGQTQSFDGMRQPLSQEEQYRQNAGQVFDTPAEGTTQGQKQGGIGM